MYFCIIHYIVGINIPILQTNTLEFTNKIYFPTLRSGKYAVSLRYAPKNSINVVF